MDLEARVAITYYKETEPWKETLTEIQAERVHSIALPMECDKYHPFQALADVLTVKEKFGAFKGTKFVMSWAYSPSVHKPRAVPQGAIIAAAMMCCDTVLARPPGMALDPDVIQACEGYTKMNGSSFEVTDDFMGTAEGAHVLYPKSWTATLLFQPPVGENDPQKTQEIFDKDWKATREYMELADRNAIYMHCLPADRNCPPDRSECAVIIPKIPHPDKHIIRGGKQWILSFAMEP